MTINEMNSLIAENNAGEQSAIEGYFLLLDAAKQNGLPEEFIDQIKEIISDEMNHSEELSKWTTYFSKIKPNET